MPGRGEYARVYYELSYALYTELDMPDAEDVFAYLRLLRAAGE